MSNFGSMQQVDLNNLMWQARAQADVFVAREVTGWSKSTLDMLAVCILSMHNSAAIAVRPPGCSKS